MKQKRYKCKHEWRYGLHIVGVGVVTYEIERWCTHCYHSERLATDRSRLVELWRELKK